ncbi:MAG: S41 family peptidase [Pseudomonadota bacterium]
MQTAAYYRYPCVFQDTLIFVSEDDLWSVPITGGTPHRLTTGLGACTHPVFSPDGCQIAFSGSEEGHTEVYIMPSTGGPVQRLTYLGDVAHVVGWDTTGITFASSANLPFSRVNELFRVDPASGATESLNLGPATFISYGGGIQAVIQRHGYREYGYWKRYRGGTAGELWIDTKGRGQFEKLVDLPGNLARPLWIEDRIYFASDHEGVGGVYSCDTSGSDLRCHFKHDVFYARNLSTDGKQIAYHAGADLYLYDVQTEQNTKIDINYSSPRHQRNRKFVSCSRYLEDYALHPEGHSLSLTSRGKAFYMGNWDGPSLQLGATNEARYRLSTWLNDGKRLLVVSDEGGQETLEIYDGETLKRINRLENTDLGRVVELQVSPTHDEVILTNHRCELIHIDLQSWKCTTLDQSKFAHIAGFDWSPDGKWVAYSWAQNHHTWVIKIVEPKKPKSQIVTKPVLMDVAPHFDPEGKYLYFISYRTFNPVRDNLHFELSFPKGARPYLLALRKDVTNPFVLGAPEFGGQDGQREEEPEEEKKSGSKKKSKKDIVKVEIDFDGIQERIKAFPVAEGNYTQIQAMPGKVIYGQCPLRGTLYDDDGDDDSCASANVQIHCYDFESQKEEVLVDHVNEFELCRKRQWMIYRSGEALRVVKAGQKPETDEDSKRYSKAQGWINLSRNKVLIDPACEWRQMLHEAWRLQRDHYWTQDMSRIDWQSVYDHYAPMLERISTREEFSDLLWEMQGELGTSHAYVIGGDIRRSPHHYGVGNLGADFVFNSKQGGYQFSNIKIGDSWDEHSASPLQQLGVNIQEGDLLWAVGGKELSQAQRPEPLLLNQADQDVQLTVSDAKGKNKRKVVVQALVSSTRLCYRSWVDKNRAYVHEKTNGRVGYVHIPDMSPWGFAEFHRGFLAECDYDGLVVDVRYNGGGNVSPLLLEKLARKRRGFDITRWFGAEPHPADSPSGPMVALTNEYAGSDGDMFSHSFKMMQLGPLIGKRTWGGVIGIWPRHSLVDRGVTTQPEFSFWFADVGWSIENYGVDPDVEVEVTPQDYGKGRDPQLDRGIQEVLQIIEQNPPLQPPQLVNERPDLRQPW